MDIKMETFHKAMLAILIVIAFIYMPIQWALTAVVIVPLLIATTGILFLTIIPLIRFFPAPVILIISGVFDFIVFLLFYKIVGIYFSPDETIFFPYCIILFSVNMLYRANRRNGKDNRLEYFPLIGFVISFILALSAHIV